MILYWIFINADDLECFFEKPKNVGISICGLHFALRKNEYLCESQRVSMNCDMCLQFLTCIHVLIFLLPRMLAVIFFWGVVGRGSINN